MTEYYYYINYLYSVFKTIRNRGEDEILFSNNFLDTTFINFRIKITLI